MNTQAKEGSYAAVGNVESEQSDKTSNNAETNNNETNLPPQLVQQLYELITKKSIETIDEITQTLNISETNESSLRENSPTEIDSLNQEHDICYQTVLDIFAFFKRRFTIPYILNTIHQCAGDIPIALQRLNHSAPKAEEPCNFSYHKITGTKDQIDAYFMF